MPKKHLTLITLILIATCLITSILLSIKKHSIPKTAVTKNDIIAKVNDYYKVRQFPHNDMSVFTSEQELFELRNVIIDKHNRYDDDYNNYEPVFLDFLLNPNVSRATKISTLWKLSQELHGDEYIYLLDVLEMLSPIELANDLISSFYSNSDNAIKIRIIHLLRTSLEIANPEEQSLEQLSFIASQTETIYDFLENEVKLRSNASIYKDVLNAFAVVATPDDMHDVLNDLIDKPTNEIPTIDILNLWSVSAFSTPDAQHLLVPDLIANLNSLTINDQQKVQDTLFHIVEQSNIDHSIKQSVVDYLGSVNPTQPTDQQTFREWLEHRYNWLTAYASVVNANIDEKNNYLASTITSSTDIFYQANIIIYAPANVLALLSDGDKSRLLSTFNSALNNQGNMQIQNEILVNAIERLGSLTDLSENDSP